MWQLKRNEVNRIAATFKDNELPGNGSVYLIEFVTLGLSPKYVIPTIINESERATIFEIDTSAGEDPENGQIVLLPGNYSVNVYRQDSVTNLNPTDVSVDGLIHVNECFVERGSNDETPIIYKYTIPSARYYVRQ